MAAKSPVYINVFISRRFHKTVFYQKTFFRVSANIAQLESMCLYREEQISILLELSHRNIQLTSSVPSQQRLLPPTHYSCCSGH